MIAFPYINLFLSWIIKIVVEEYGAFKTATLIRPLLGSTRCGLNGVFFFLILYLICLEPGSPSFCYKFVLL